VARINVEEQWWTDLRRFKLAELIGDDALADGIMLAAWRVAQDFWKNGKKPIPRSVFLKLRGSTELIKSKLAVQRGGHFYLKGSQFRFQWLIDRQEAQKESVAARSRNNKKKTLANALQTHCKPIASSSSSSSSSKELNTNTAHEEKISEPENSHSNPDSNSSRQPDLKSQIQICLDEWKETLSVRNIERDPRLDENKIARLIKTYNVERVQSAIRGMRFEPSGKDFNPNANCYIARLEKPDAFNRLETIGSSKANKPVEKKLYKHAQL
jgi:hypothetical protein